MIDKLFQICVQLLLWLADITGTTYNEINIYVFVVAGPLVFFIMLFMIIRYKRIIHKLKKRDKEISFKRLKT